MTNLILTISILISSFFIEGIDTERPAHAAGVTHIINTSIENGGVELAIVLWIDKSGSIVDGRVPQVTWAEIEPLITLVDQVNGTLAIGIIGAETREKMAFYSSGSDKLSKPIRKPSMTASDYKRALISYKKRLKRQSQAIDQDKLRSDFESKVKAMLDYSSLEQASLVCEGLNVANRIFEQQNHAGATKFLLMVTDFLANGQESCEKVSSDTNMISVNRLSANRAGGYKTLHFVDTASAVRHIINNS